jgi:hypothetical protein
MESRLNRDFNKIFRILKMNKNPGHLVNLVKIVVQTKAMAGRFFFLAENKPHQWDIGRLFIERIFAIEIKYKPPPQGGTKTKVK